MRIVLESGMIVCALILMDIFVKSKNVSDSLNRNCSIKNLHLNNKILNIVEMIFDFIYLILVPGPTKPPNPTETTTKPTVISTLLTTTITKHSKGKFKQSNEERTKNIS